MLDTIFKLWIMFWIAGICYELGQIHMHLHEVSQCSDSNSLEEYGKSFKEYAAEILKEGK